MEKNLCFRTLSCEDEKEIEKMIYTYYREDELSQCASISNQEKQFGASIYMKHVIPQGLSVGVFKLSSGEMLGCCIVCDRKRYPNILDDLEAHGFQGLQKLIRFEEHCSQDFECMLADVKCMLLDIVVVQPSASRQGLAKQLVDRVELLGLEKGYDVVFGISLPTHMRRVIGRNGWKLFYEKQVVYSNYRDPIVDDTVFQNVSVNYAAAVPFCKYLQKKM